MMKKIEIELKTTTYLFTGGANLQTELRTESFNGLFRYWFRLAGGRFSDEKRIFGWGGEKANRGIVNMHFIEGEIKKRLFEKIFDEKGFVKKERGINYIGFSLDQRFKIKGENT